MRLIILLSLCVFSFNAFSCDDKEADTIVLDRLTMMAKRYSTTKVGVGASMQWGDTRITNITILDGVGGNDGVKVDRIGAIYINMDTCVVKAKLVSTYDILNVK